MDVRAIRTAADHAWALAQIERLWDRAEPGTADGDRFEVLSTLIDAYERTHLPVPPPDSGSREPSSDQARQARPGK